MKKISTYLSCFALGFCFFSLVACTETTGTGNSAGKPKVAERKLTREDVALRFLTAYIQGDRQSASKYATGLAIAKLPWGRPSTSYLPHYDDKHLLWFSGGWAKPIYQEVNGQMMIYDFDVHRKY